MSDKQGPNRSPIGNASKEDGIRPRTKTTLLNKGKVYAQTLGKRQ